MVIIIAVRVAWDVLGAFRVAGAVVEFTERVAFKRAAVAVALVVVRAGGIAGIPAFAADKTGVATALGTAWVTATLGAAWVTAALRAAGITAACRIAIGIATTVGIAGITTAVRIARIITATA